MTLAGVPRGRQGDALTRMLRDRITDGTLVPGVHLPSSRRLAADLGVSRGVVVAAYEQLTAEGHLDAAPGSGTSVAGRPGAPTSVAPLIEIDPIGGLNPGQPDPALFPRQAWQRAARCAFSTLPDNAFSYGDPRGHLPLRSEMVAYLGRTRSIHTDVSRIVITSGFAQCLNLVVQTLVRSTGRAIIAVEDPGPAGAAAQLAWLGAELVAVPVDAHGLDVAALARTRAQAVLVTPAHHYPTGVTLAPERRRQLVEWAGAHGGLIIEDDYDAEYRYDRSPLTSLHALAPQHVIAAGSVSKSLGPALRLGWAAVPDHLVAGITAAKANADLGTSVITQATLAEFVGAGALDRHLRRTRTIYRRRRDRLIDALEVASDLTISGVAAGLHLLVGLPTSCDAAALAEVACAGGFAAQPLDRYRHRPGTPGVVLGYAGVPEHAIGSAAAPFIEALATQRRTRGR